MTAVQRRHFERRLGHRLRILGIGIVVLSSVPLQSHAQQPTPRDTSTPRARIVPPPVPVRSPTVFALVPDALLKQPDSTLGQARQAAESLGFGFAVKGVAHFSIVDPRHGAVYYVPTDVSRGYLIVIPGHRPDIVRGVVTADSLRHRIKHYRESAGLPLRAPPQKCCS
jgi:hypothetical protein